MIDDGESPDRLSDKPVEDVVWADEQLLIPDELFGAPPPQLAPDSPQAAFSGEPVLTLPVGIWGDTTEVVGGAEPDFVEADSDEGWWLPGAPGDSVVADPPVVMADSPAPPASRRPTIAPAGELRSSGGLQVKQWFAAPGLVVLAVVGLLLVLSARGEETPPAADGQRQIDAAGVQTPSTLPVAALASAPTTSVAAAPPSTQPAPTAEEAPLTTSPPSSSSPVARTPVTTAPPREATPSGAAVSPPAPAPTPTAAASPTNAAPPPTTPPEPPPETTLTTRRPRATVPETTIAPSTTLLTSASLLGT